MYDLTFDPEKYEVKTCEFGERKVTYRAFEHIVYCANPVSKVQTLNIYVPECYYEGGEINGYSLHTAPIFAPNTVGGYMEGPAMEVGSFAPRICCDVCGHQRSQHWYEVKGIFRWWCR